MSNNPIESQQSPNDTDKSPATPKKRFSIIWRFWGFVFFRFVPLLLVIAILWAGYNVVQLVVRRIDEQLDANSRISAYQATATTIAVQSDDDGVKHISPRSNAREVPANHFSRMRDDNGAQILVTNTPRGNDLILPAVNTPEPVVTATPEAPFATATPELPANTAPIVLPTLLVPNNPSAEVVAPTAVPPPAELIPRNHELVNIMLLGSDREITGDNITRTDTMIIVSINRDTDTVAMLSLPRDLLVYIPGWTMQRLNLAYGRGEAVGWTDGGFGLLRQTIFYNFGINVHYFGIVDLSGVEEIIDTVDGIDVAVDCALQDHPLVGARVPDDAILVDENDNLYTLPVGYYHFDGAESLWYARSRRNSDDFDRGRRQQQVIRALWRKALDTGQLSNFPSLWDRGLEIVDTDLDFNTMLNLLPIALTLDESRIESFTLIRRFHTTPWTMPDGANVQLPNPEPIRDLLIDFYTPPTENQLFREGAQIAVFNGTNNPNWDIVAASRLGWDSFRAVAAGQAEGGTVTDTILIDHTGQTKGSSLNEIANILNVNQDNIRVEPDPNRTVDFEVILGETYNSCTFAVLPVQ